MGASTAGKGSVRTAAMAASRIVTIIWALVNAYTILLHAVEAPIGAPAARFLAVRSPEQILPKGVIRLPTVFIAHGFIGLQADVTEEAARLAVRNWVPFLGGVASREGLLPVG